MAETASSTDEPLDADSGSIPTAGAIGDVPDSDGDGEPVEDAQGEVAAVEGAEVEGAEVEGPEVEGAEPGEPARERSTSATFSSRNRGCISPSCRPRRIRDVV